MASTTADSMSPSSSMFGGHIDTIINNLDSLSSTQLYALIVGLTVLICFVLLGNAPDPATPPTLASSPSQKLLTRQSSTLSTSSGPEPRWQYFQYFNYLIVGAFGYSVMDFVWNVQHYYREHSNGSHTVMIQFLATWSFFVLYFFAFFGVTFVHADLMNNGSNHDCHENTSEATAQLNAATLKSVPKIQPPAPSTPIGMSNDAVSCAKARNIPVACKAPSTNEELTSLSDEDIAHLVLKNRLKDHELEKVLTPHRAVAVRRLITSTKLASLDSASQQQAFALENLPSEHALDYSRVYGTNCESVIGYVPIPVGVVGPLTVNEETYYVPMATTEGCLVASTNRGAKAITAGGGAFCEIVRDGITRAPCVRLPTARQAAQLHAWCEDSSNFAKLKSAFESTTSFGKLLHCKPTVAGRNVYLRLVCFSGDAMGMNMVSKGSLAVIDCLRANFDPNLQLVALSGNMCTDKKAAATNWLEGRGKSVVVEATIPKDIVRSVLKTSVKAIVDTNLHKNLIGSAMAGTIGGFNAHASNIVTAVFLATGQDAAQNVESSNCITLLEETDEGDLWISCTMPSLEVGTVGGGTSLPAQAACLQMLGCQGGGLVPGENSKTLAKVIAAATMAGELSLLAALAGNTLVSAHMQHNRKK